VITDISFRAMGSQCRIVVDGEAGLVDRAQTRIADLERRWSRFLPDSEITRVNAAAGSMAVVSSDTYQLVERAASAVDETDGCFDPTMLCELAELGYDRSLEQLAPPRAPVDRRAVRRGDRRAEPRFPPARISLFPTIRGVLVPSGCAFDPGGIGKGLAGDIVVAEMLAAGARGVVVELGGDVRVLGVPFAGESWKVLIADPFERDEAIGTVQLVDGAVATSSTLKRRWHHDDGDHHHVLDPSTRKPSRSGLIAVTAVAGTGWWAEALAKAVLVAGLRHGEQIVRRHGASVLAVRTDGRFEILGTRDLISVPS
jgi:thiamine biosynthesis lipoprotein